jgi:RNA polymerase sigma factor (sigma-70 family)
LHVALMGALATLPVRDQAIVVLRHWEDQSVDTVAEILGVSVSVVKMQSARALIRLRAILGEDFILS